MKSITFAFLAALLGQEAAGHATFQDLWINGVDYVGQCVRQPPSNSPVTDVTSTDIRCNAGTSAVSYKCKVAAGDTVKQPGDRSCDNEAIGGAHYGPVAAYLSAVDDSASADGSDGWFKIFEDSWAQNPDGSSGSDDFWGTKDINTCCGKMDVVIPTNIAPGDYLLRAEALALHTASGTGGAQFYVSCYQLTISGSGTAEPGTVELPGAYSASDPGILINIYQVLTTYEAPGPTVYSGGSTRSAGAACEGCESSCTAGSGATGTASSVALSASTDGSSSCSVALYGQCGGTDYTASQSGACTVLSDAYSQCA